MNYQTVLENEVGRLGAAGGIGYPHLARTRSVASFAHGGHPHTGLNCSVNRAKSAITKPDAAINPEKP